MYVLMMFEQQSNFLLHYLRQLFLIKIYLRMHGCLEWIHTYIMCIVHAVHNEHYKTADLVLEGGVC